MEHVALVSVLLLLQYVVFVMRTGQARLKSGLAAPAVSGDPVFEANFRVQQNTMEQLVVVLPSLWLFATYVQAESAAALGLVFFIGRILYARGYLNEEPMKRGPGFMIGGLATLVLLLGSLIGLLGGFF